MAFKLYDTYGFPIDLTAEILEEKNIKIDYEGFEKCMQQQRSRARSSRKVGEEAGWDESEFDKIKEKTVFLGYETLKAQAKIIAVSSEEGSDAVVVLDQTPFYAESGGQIGDSGVIFNDNFSMRVTDTKKIGNGVFLHYGIVEKGTAEAGDAVTAQVDEVKRMNIARNHSSTHLLQKALKMVLGDHVAQSGSHVSDKRLRFDFTHFEALTKEEIAKVEQLVNDAILKGMDIIAEEMDFEEAKSKGAEALFDEKYEDVVRVVSMGDFSMELCGGTHLDNTAKAGLFKIISENGVSTGIRRIEAVTGSGVLQMLKTQEDLLTETAKALKITNIYDVGQKTKQLSEELRESNKIIEELKAKISSNLVDEIAGGYKNVEGIRLITAINDNISMDQMRMIGDKIKERAKDDLLFVMAGINNEKITF